MKRVLSYAFAMVFTSFLFGQKAQAQELQQNTNESNNKEINNAVVQPGVYEQSDKVTFPKSQASSQREFSDWFNFLGSATESGFLSAQCFGNGSLWPDTLVLQSFGDGAGGNVLNHVRNVSTGSTIDPKDGFVFQNSFSENTEYSVDSIQFAYRYTRPVDEVPDGFDTTFTTDTLPVWTANGMTPDTFHYNVDTGWTYMFDTATQTWDSMSTDAWELAMFTYRTATDFDEDVTHVWAPYFRPTAVDSATGEILDSMMIGPDETLVAMDTVVREIEEIVPGQMRKVRDYLIVQFYDEPRIGRGRFTNPAAGTEGDFISIEYNRNTLVGRSPRYQDTIFLDESFVTDEDGQAMNGVITFGIPENRSNIPAGGIAAFTVTYFPDQEYSLFDTLQEDWDPAPVNKLNHFRISICQEQGKTDLQSENYRMLANQIARYGIGADNLIARNYFSGNTSTETNQFLNASFYLSTANLSAEEADLNFMDLKVFPNPISNGQELNIEFELAENQDIAISVFNAQGKRVQSQATRTYLAGAHNTTLNLNNLNTGIYFVNFQVDGEVITKKVSVVK